MKQITHGEYQQRVNNLQRLMSDLDLDGYLVTSRDNMFYLTGLVCDPLERPFFLLLRRDGSLTFLVPALEESHIQSKYEPAQVTVYWEYPAPEGLGWSDCLPDFLSGMTRLGIEPSLKMEIRADLDGVCLEVLPLIERLRAVKSPAEIALIKRAAECAVFGVERLIAASYYGSWVAEGFADTRQLMKRIMHVSEDFNPLLSKAVMGTWAAPRSAQPHSIPRLNDRLDKLAHVALVLTSVQGYAAECERTYFTSRPDQQMKDHFQIMLEARHKAFRMVRPGVQCSEIDSVTTEFLEHKGVADKRLHRTGHGLGLAYHAEAPWIAEGCDDILQPGMVISIEPGLYFPDVCGFRHSDTVLVTEESCRNLTAHDDQLEDLVITQWKPWRRLKGRLIRFALGVQPASESQAQTATTTLPCTSVP